MLDEEVAQDEERERAIPNNNHPFQRALESKRWPGDCSDPRTLFDPNLTIDAILDKFDHKQNDVWTSTCSIFREKAERPYSKANDTTPSNGVIHIKPFYFGMPLGKGCTACTAAYVVGADD